jgi:hypothetical protein
LHHLLKGLGRLKQLPGLLVDGWHMVLHLEKWDKKARIKIEASCALSDYPWSLVSVSLEKKMKEEVL